MDSVLMIERPDVIALAAELAELRRESVADALSDALRSAVERERQRQGLREERGRQVDEVLARIHALLPNPRPTSNHDWLYDENGLPI